MPKPFDKEDFFLDLGLEDVKTKEDLEKMVKETMTEQREYEAENKYVDDLLEEAAKHTVVDLPEELVHEEIHRMMHQYEENLKMQGITLDMFYQFTNSSEEDLEKQMHPEAEKRVKYRFMLEEIATLEKVEVTDEEANKEAEDLKTFYPTNVLVTGYDIILFWVIRMMFSGIEHTGEVPFKDVLIHGIVRDAQGRKMSKSLGNGIDPLEIIDKYGTDALRLSLIMGITPGNDIRYMPEKLESASNFANKLWNASKFVLMNINGIQSGDGGKNVSSSSIMDINVSKLEYEDKWILSKLNTLIKEATANLDNFDMGVYAQKIYDFTWNEFCDWYIEIVKSRLYNQENTDEKAVESRITAQKVLNKVLGDILKLLHPIMPFITEKIYDELYTNDESIMISAWPTYCEEYEFEKEEYHLEEIKKIIIQIRNTRTNMNVHPSKKSELIFVIDDDEYKTLIENSKSWIEKLGFASKIEIEKNETNIPKHVVTLLADGIKAFIPSEELVDLAEEKAKLEAEKTRLEAEVARSTKMLSNPGFINKAPEAKVQEEKEKMQKYKEMLEDTIKRLEQI